MDWQGLNLGTTKEYAWKDVYRGVHVLGVGLVEELVVNKGIVTALWREMIMEDSCLKLCEAA